MEGGREGGREVGREGGREGGTEGVGGQEWTEGTLYAYAWIWNGVFNVVLMSDKKKETGSPWHAF